MQSQTPHPEPKEAAQTTINGGQPRTASSAGVAAVPPALLHPDVSAQETLRAENKSRTKSAGNTNELMGLFIPPSETNDAAVPPSFTALNNDPPPPPPLPTETPILRTSLDEKPRSHRRMPSTIRVHPGHQRQVSWGLDASDVLPSNFADSMDLPPPSFRRPRSGSGRISLEDLQNTRPMENEAESYIIRALETRDVHGEKKLVEVGPVLSNIPREDLDALDQPAEQEDSVPSAPNSRSSMQREGSSREDTPLGRPAVIRRVQSRVAAHRRTGTVGDQLELLAASLDVVHTQHIDLLTDDHSEGMLPAPLQNRPVHAGDTLQHNANLLFNRHRSPTDEMRDEEMGSVTQVKSDDSAETPASKRWSLLRNNINAVQGPASPVAAADNSSLADQHSLETIGKIEEEQEGVGGSDDSPPEGENSRDKLDPKGVGLEGYQQLSYKVQKKHRFAAELEDFFAPRRRTINNFLRLVVLGIILPSTGIALLLFYVAGNPPTGVIDLESNLTKSETGGHLVNTNGEFVNPEQASSSWWLIFIGVRQVVTFVMAKAVELFFIDFLSVRSRFSVKYIGPWVTLFILQTKGWPFLIFMWGIFNSALLSGTKPFFHHWAYWQDYIGVFNRSNPSGNVVNNPQWHDVIIICIVVGIAVSLKRFWLGLYLGRQTFEQYSDQLASVMKKILYISEVASLGRTFERLEKQSESTGKRRSYVTAASIGLNQEQFNGLMNMSDDSTTGGVSQTEVGESATKLVIDPNDRLPLTGSLSSTQKARISQLLGQWEEPTISHGAESVNKATVGELLQFRRALEYLNTAFPFSGSFGIADKRESTIQSAQEVYRRLLDGSPNPTTLQFDVIAVLGLNKSGLLDQEKLKELIKLFRPDRDGTLHCIDFVKAVDGVYKELRLLRAAVANSSKIDRAFESILNFIFYTVATCIILSRIGYDPLALFLSISGVILGFAFMVGSASSKYFEGLLFIVVRRPYQVGDGIAVSDVNEELEPDSPFWIVEDVDLFTTKVIFHRSFERATLSNGSLANSRVINATLSTQAKVIVKLKFPVSVSYEKLQIFHQALDQFFKNRPREWAEFMMFCLLRIEADLGFVEYAVIGRHRAPWVAYGELLQSRADLMHFSMELSKKLDIWYRNPPVPVDLTFAASSKVGLSEMVQQATETGDWQGDVEMEPLVGSRSESFQGDALDLKDLQKQFRPRA